MNDTERCFEYGYRITSGAGEGREVWQVDHGTDGTWTPWQPDLGIPHVDTDTHNVIESIEEALTQAGVTGVILRREVTVITGPAAEVGHAP